MNKNKILIASNNKNKIKEIKKILHFDDIDFITKSNLPDVEEDKDSFLGNAYKKAHVIAKKFNIVSMSDDSGIEVYSLNGEPGVYSARYAGKDQDDEKNNMKLLSKLKNKHDRRARFVAVIVISRPDGKYWVSRGICEGKIAKKPRGNNGFGYDPIFQPENFNRTTAELSPDEKNKISHRGKALRKLYKSIKKNKKEIFKKN